MKPRSICLITTGHLASCPRIVKAADAAVEDGWRVTVIAASSLSWQRDIDRRMAASRPWQLKQLEWGRDRTPGRNRFLRARYHAAGALTRCFGAGTPTALMVAAAAWPASELTSLAAQTPADLYFGGGGGGTLVAAAAAAITRKPFGVDFEDLHSAEAPPGSAAARYWRLAEDRLLKTATVVTAGSEAIAEAYARRGSREVLAIHNVLPLPADTPDFRTAREQVRLYWFGQTIGPHRGLEECLDALAHTRLRASLSLRGSPDPAFRAAVEQRVRSMPALSLEWLPFEDPDQMVRACAGFDVGLAYEPAATANSLRLLSNKCLTYMAAGVAPLLSRTEGTAAVLRDLRDAALTASPSSPAELRETVATLRDRERVVCARRAAYQAVVRRWHWEHPLERGRLLRAFDAAVQ